MKKSGKVVNATSILVMKVEKIHIKNGVCNDPHRCVFALALRGTPGFEQVRVGQYITKIYTHKLITRYQTPPEIRGQLKVFDEGGTWELGTGLFEFNPPPPPRYCSPEKKKARAEYDKQPERVECRKNNKTFKGKGRRVVLKNI